VVAQNNQSGWKAGESGVNWGMSLILILSGNFFILIFSLIGAQASFFQRRWKWFALTLACAILSGACIAVEAYDSLCPSERDVPVVMRQPTTPL
jgi:glucan phosphoethanolaminetransferase (alkaline phosphatase superfamily)